MKPYCNWKFKIGQRVRKTKGSSWQGCVVGFYSTFLTPEGYAVESEREPGSVQIYPASALEVCAGTGAVIRTYEDGMRDGIQKCADYLTSEAEAMLAQRDAIIQTGRFEPKGRIIPESMRYGLSYERRVLADKLLSDAEQLLKLMPK